MRRTVFCLLCCAVVSNARAETINSQNFENEGFGGVAHLLESMTPEQRAEVMKQAAGKMDELQSMSPQQQQQLVKQMRDIATTIDFDNIDPAKLDASKSQSVADNQKNFDTYQKKYQKGAIKNSVVLYPPNKKVAGTITVKNQPQ